MASSWSISREILPGSRRVPELDELVKKNNIKTVVVYGIATGYCMRATALDAAAAEYKVVLVKNLRRGVAADISQKATEEKKGKGSSFLTT